MSNGVIVIVGSGGMGVAIAHRLGSGRTIVLSDVNSRNLEAATLALSANGHDVHGTTVDVTSPRSVTDLAGYAAALGPVTSVVHTAGVSPEQAGIETILHVDLVGVALVLEHFGEVIQAGGAGVVIASMAGHFHPAMDPGVEHELASAPSAGPAGDPSVCARAVPQPSRGLRLRQACQPPPGRRGGIRMGQAWCAHQLHQSWGHLHGHGNPRTQRQFGGGDQGDDRQVRCRSNRHPGRHRGRCRLFCSVRLPASSPAPTSSSTAGSPVLSKPACPYFDQVHAAARAGPLGNRFGNNTPRNPAESARRHAIGGIREPRLTASMKRRAWSGTPGT